MIEKFISSIANFNTMAIDSIEKQLFQEAVVYLNENEKILEYAASCGRTIDRSVIILTLRNEACVHQRLWNLEKSANYL
jgi:hypothetical protein